MRILSQLLGRDVCKMDKEGKDMASVTQPIKHMTVEFDNAKEEESFFKYAFGFFKPDQRTKEISQMIKNHKRAKERKR